MCLVCESSAGVVQKTFGHRGLDFSRAVGGQSSVLPLLQSLTLLNPQFLLVPPKLPKSRNLLFPPVPLACELAVEAELPTEREKKRKELNKQRLGSLKASRDKFSKGWEMHILINSLPATYSTSKFPKHSHVCSGICSSYHYFDEIGGTDCNISGNSH